MKKFLSLLLVALLACSAAMAESVPFQTVNAFVTITDETGAIALACEPVAVVDMDNDGALTISDALRMAHTEHHEDGASAYADVMTDYGLSLTKLWGVENGGAYGYYLDHASPLSLLDPVAEGSYIQAFVYTDMTTWSDTYCYFDAQVLVAPAGAAIPLTLCAAGWDENFMPVSVPVEGAQLTVDGVASGVYTEADGSVLFTLDTPGAYLISATSDTVNLVAPVCLLVISE